MLSFEFFSYDETRSSIPLPLIEATCNHAQEPLLLPNGRATIPQEIFPIPISISKISFDKPLPNNSMKFPAIPLVQKIRQDLDHGCRIATNLLLAAGFEGWSPIQELILRDLIIIHQCYTRQQCARSPISLATKFRRNKKCNIANSLFQPHGTQPSQKLVNQFSFMYFECRKIHFQLKISSSHDEGSCQT